MKLFQTFLLLVLMALSSTPTSGQSNSTKCESEGHTAHESDCRKYYECVDNGNGSYDRFESSCPSGTAFDENLQVCNFEHEVQDCPGAMTTEPSTQTTSDMNGSTSESSTTTEDPENTTLAGPRPSKGKCEAEGFFGEPDDCRKFYRCVGDGEEFTKSEFNCPESTAWDQDSQTCDHDSMVASCEEQGLTTSPETTDASSDLAASSSGAASSASYGSADSSSAGSSSASSDPAVLSSEDASSAIYDSAASSSGDASSPSVNSAVSLNLDLSSESSDPAVLSSEDASSASYGLAGFSSADSSSASSDPAVLSNVDSLSESSDQSELISD